MADRQQIGRVLNIFAGFDNDAHTLPSELVQARDKYREVHDTWRTLREPETTEEDALRQMATAFAEGADLDTEAVYAVRREQEDYLLKHRTLDRAREIVAGRLYDVAVECADEIVVGHLRPAQTAVLAEAEKAHAAYSRYGEVPSALLAAPASARTAFGKLDELVRRFQLIRSTVSAVRLVAGGVQHDHQGWFSTIRNCEVVWPQLTGHRNMPGSRVPPWPTDDPKGYLLFLLRDDVEAWVPTALEQDARFWEVFAEQYDRQVTSVHNAQAWSATFA